VLLPTLSSPINTTSSITLPRSGACTPPLPLLRYRILPSISVLALLDFKKRFFKKAECYCCRRLTSPFSTLFPSFTLPRSGACRVHSAKSPLHYTIFPQSVYFSFTKCMVFTFGAFRHDQFIDRASEWRFLYRRVLSEYHSEALLELWQYRFFFGCLFDQLGE